MSDHGVGVGRWISKKGSCERCKKFEGGLYGLLLMLVECYGQLDGGVQFTKVYLRGSGGSGMGHKALKGMICIEDVEWSIRD